MKTKRLRAFLLLSVVFIVSAPLRRGKTLTTTAWILKKIEQFVEKRKKDPSFMGRVYTNYPVKHPKYGYTDTCKVLTNSKVENPVLGFTNDIKESICHNAVIDSFIVFDEAHRLFDSRKWKDFDDNVRDFFVWAGQNNNDVVLITPHPNRIETVVRELCEAFYYVKKIAIPLIDYPLLFIVEGYEVQEDYRKPGMEFSREYIPFSRRVSRSYDTHFFRNIPDEPFITPNWGDVIQDHIGEERFKKFTDVEKKPKKNKSISLYKITSGIRILAAAILLMLSYASVFVLNMLNLDLNRVPFILKFVSFSIDKYSSVRGISPRRAVVSNECI